MIIIALILLSLFFFGIALYIFLLFRLHSMLLPDLSIEKLASKRKITNILFVYPHPDDETMASGLLMRKLSKDKRFHVHAISLSRGERGDEKYEGMNAEELGHIRSQEYAHSVDILGVSSFTIKNFGDGAIPTKRDAIFEYIEKYMIDRQIHVIVTFERTGMYGHPDHVSLSSIVYALSKKHKTIDTLFSTLPEKIERRLDIKAHMRDDVALEHFDLNEQPQYKLVHFRGLLAKYRAARAHKSQILSHKGPLWLQMLFMPVEYYTEQYKQGEDNGDLIADPAK